MAAAIASVPALVLGLWTGVGVGFAGPAQADPVMQGIYNYQQEGLDAATWTIYPSCVPVVGDLREPLYLPVACMLHVQGSKGVSGGDARMAGGQWQFTTSIKEGIKCADGSWAPIEETYRFNDVTLTGTRQVANNAVCGLAPAIHTFPFTLSFKESLPIPVDQYPLDCEPWGLRLCT
ncbi:hypothetical protein [Mycolicibacterium goodii]|uniref:Secreted protein n=1 Tax=Mycolicibacterium goodii TaxID=134601 RepID=A0ABS6HXK6_MYCGD|nr:hypothetical protein [Mycolicibacterium goodii]MBU8827295.1 hypothetical protein [Mycolicibacterium goodii]MBU8841007.1 hypothetical protein [Mycolicibacterium goodii]